MIEKLDFTEPFRGRLDAMMKGLERQESLKNTIKFSQARGAHILVHLFSTIILFSDSNFKLLNNLFF